MLLMVGSCSHSEVAHVRMSPGNVFSRLDFDRAVAYDYNGEEEEIISAEGKLALSINKQVQLTGPQAARITNILCDKASYGGPVMMCFIPRLGIVFYKGSVPKAHVSICLECNYAHSSLQIPQAAAGFSAAGKSSISSFKSDIGL
ncbi:MAG TPA: hypothetical protein VFO93_09880 [Hymenobacter sp.]|uniref:hypothetical protein n=1 Tax=Hymenobacter sp. TaxID=1898978 RepID=UPI002D802BBF|nr:hypothetical protein [Hymenobacter sp.]HET9503841.1 hypothetical protein [Hymenobacter sp.]